MFPVDLNAIADQEACEYDCWPWLAGLGMKILMNTPGQGHNKDNLDLRPGFNLYIGLSVSTCN